MREIIKCCCADDFCTMEMYVDRSSTTVDIELFMKTGDIYSICLDANSTIKLIEKLKQCLVDIGEV